MIKNKQISNILLGTYKERKYIFNLTKTLKLPLDMHKDGVFIIGSEVESKRKLIYHYVENLIKQNINVVMISDDPKAVNNIVKISKRNSFTNLEVNDFKIPFEITSFFNKGGLSLYLINSYQERKITNLCPSQHNRQLSHLLRQINESNVNKANLVLIIDTEEHYKENLDDFNKCISDLIKANMGFIATGLTASQFNEDLYENIFLFKLYDPREDAPNFIKELCSNNRDKPKIFDYRDIVCLRDQECFYLKKSDINTRFLFDYKSE